MIDLNTLFSNALTAAITNAVAPLNERIAALESANDILHRVQHEDMVAMRDRIAALEDQAIVTSNAVDTRISRLENNPAQGVDSEWDIGRLEQRVAALESETQGENRYLNRDDVAELIAEAMDDHTSTYDHDSYDNAVSDLEDRDFVTNDSLEDAVREAVGNLSFDISVS